MEPAPDQVQVRDAIIELCGQAQYEKASCAAKNSVRQSKGAGWALELLAYARCAAGDFYGAFAVLGSLPLTEMAVYLKAFCCLSMGRPLEALRLLDEFLKNGSTGAIPQESLFAEVRIGDIQRLRTYALDAYQKAEFPPQLTERIPFLLPQFSSTEKSNEIHEIQHYSKRARLQACVIEPKVSALCVENSQNHARSRLSREGLDPNLNFESPMGCPYQDSRRAKNLYETRMYSQARRLYDRIVGSHPYFTENMEEYPSLLWHLGDEEGLQFIFEKWQRHPRTKYLSLLAAGNLMSLKQNPDIAIRCFAKAHATERGSSSQHLICMGFEYLAIEDALSAEECFERALKSGSNAGKPSLGLGILNYKRDQLDVAERHFRQAAQLMPYDPAPHTYLASIYFKHKRFKDCAAEAEVSLKLCPTDLRALYLKASVLSSLGKEEEALSILGSIRSLEPLDPTSHLLIAEHLNNMGRKAAAIKACCFALDLEPQNSSILDKLQAITREQ